MDGVYYSELLQIYGGLLTEKHRAVAEAYYSLDLSLAEIAEENGVSRQSVSDALAATRKKLDFYEENLKIYSTKREINAIIDENTLKETKLEKIKNLVGEV
ncbi:MAG: sigma factor-like helix-turn-helix DNA-binding protein [Candidatus Borkfalkiaceae bacterium]|nr:sigma factor-like helix-turn-helix DNA-binding protein [Eubacteriales bacterium]MDY5819780.1 sigma factor-like helix-turn-helix DNA-binding protein [Christensenellaceae bacterium]